MMKKCSGSGPWTALTVGLGVFLAAGPAESASGVITMSWDGCASGVSDVATTPGGVSSLYFSVLGNDELHTGYQVRFMFGSAEKTVPDAWRFDEGGCNGGSDLLQINHLPPAAVSKSCPAFQGAGPSFQIRQFALMPAGAAYATSLMRGLLVDSYETPVQSNPAQRYFLAEFRFDHMFSVNGTTTPGVDCGGLETPLCFYLLNGSDQAAGTGWSGYVRASDGLEYPFAVSSLSDVAATVNGIPGCFHVSTPATTWGQLKHVYHR